MYDQGCSSPTTTVLYNDNTFIIDWIHAKEKDRELLAVFYYEKTEYYSYKTITQNPQNLFRKTVKLFPEHKKLILTKIKEFITLVHNKYGGNYENN